MKLSPADAATTVENAPLGARAAVIERVQAPLASPRLSPSERPANETCAVIERELASARAVER